MKRLSKWVLAATAVVGGLGGAFFAGRALAGGIPATGALQYSGLVTDANGIPITGTHSIQVNFWTAATGGSSGCQIVDDTATRDNGRFSIVLPDTCTQMVQSTPDIWAQVLLDGVSFGRTAVGAVPFAVEASHAVTADTASGASGTLQTTLDGLTAPFSKVLVHAVTPFALPASTFTKIPYLTETFDDQNEFDPTTSQFTATVAGDYLVCASITGMPVGFEVDAYVGTTRTRPIVYDTVASAGTGCGVVRLAAAQTLDLRAYSTAGTGATINSNTLWDTLSISRMR